MCLLPQLDCLTIVPDRAATEMSRECHVQRGTPLHCLRTLKLLDFNDSGHERMRAHAAIPRDIPINQTMTFSRSAL